MTNKELKNKIERGMVKITLRKEKKQLESEGQTPVLTVNADGIVGWEPEDHISRSSKVIEWEDLDKINLMLE